MVLGRNRAVESFEGRQKMLDQFSKGSKILISVGLVLIVALLIYRAVG